MTATAWAEARWIARESGTALDRTEVTLAEALGFALAAPLVALAPLPAYDAAAMDGYAVAGCGPWRITGRVLAGDPTPREHLSPGFAVEIGTGATVPSAAEAVLPSGWRGEEIELLPLSAPEGPVLRPAAVTRQRTKPAEQSGWTR